LEQHSARWPEHILPRTSARKRSPSFFGLVLIYSAYQSFFAPEMNIRESLEPDPLATKFKLNGDYPAGNKRQPLRATGVAR
jgi:hypothetical protein